MSKKSKEIKDVKIEDIYKKKTHHEHILSHSDTYIGSVQVDEKMMFIYDKENNLILEETIDYVAGFFKIFDEVLVNARDHSIRDKTCKNIKIYLDKQTGEIKVVNDGNGIAVAIHDDYNIYLPELIFGHLLTSSNYEVKGKVVGGKNGYGSKVCLKKGTMMPTFAGEIKKIEDIEKGDKLIGDDGTPRNVLDIKTGNAKLFEISQQSYEPYTVTEDHILCLRMPDHKVIFWSETEKSWTMLWLNKNDVQIKNKSIQVHDKEKYDDMVEFAKTISDDNTLDISVKDYVKLDETTKKHLSGYTGQCVQWESKEVELDPYVLGLGLWLGDGYQSGSDFAINAEVSLNNLINNKRIPKEYLVNSRDVRLKVLAGFIDSNGQVTKEGFRIQIAPQIGKGINHEELMEDLIFLVRSLGFKACTYEGELRNDEVITLDISGEGVQDIPTKVAGKKCDTPKDKNTTGTGNLTVKEVESGDFVGLATDGNQRFVLENFTVTHNCNIYSKRFIVHTVGLDKEKKKKEYIQVFEDNMFKINKPIVKDVDQSTKQFTSISYIPDYSRFGMTGITNDMYNLLVKRCYDIAACTEANVFINDEPVKCKNFKDYIGMYYKEKKIQIVYEKINPRWEVAVVFNEDDGYRQISFVNGISTFQGGTHVSHVVETITENVRDYIKAQAKYKHLKIQPTTIRQYLTFFVNCVIEDPCFSSQTKEFMTSKKKSWCTCGNNCADAVCKISDDMIKKICDSGLLKEVVELSEFKEMKELAKTDGKKTGSLKGQVKLIDANWAGKRNSDKTSLILTEGDSAKSFAVSGLEVVGNDKYGIFPLRGKLLNVRNASPKQIRDNKEFAALKVILGLKQGMKYQDVSKLRYGSIIILTDQDPDGSHIKGLIINMFEFFWPSLLQIDGFIKTVNTPIVKSWKKSDSDKKKLEIFYTLSDYEKWVKEKGEEIDKWESKYYKGLGTSTDKEAKESFVDFDEKLISFIWEKNNEDNNDDDSEDKTNAKKKPAKIDKKVKEEKEEDEENEDEDKSEKSSKSKSNNDDDDDDDDDDSSYTKSNSHIAIDKAFNKKKANPRKLWLKKLDRNNLIEYRGNTRIPYSDFIDKDLIFFSNMDNDRSIASALDGLKPSTRKILFACFKRGRKSKESKVAQLAGYVSEHTDYHHGEDSLHGAIIGLAQNFPGSNNINLLKPNGNFGYRRLGGKEHASPRYIFTQVDPITNKIFREEDDNILDYMYNDGDMVEPHTFAPIIPMVLVNGSIGIGTGWSSTIYPHNPIDLVDNIKRMIKGEPYVEMKPWFNGFKGTINKIKDNEFQIKGKYSIDGKNIHIEDIPIVNGWIEPYEKDLEDNVSTSKDDNLKIESIAKKAGNNIIDITVTFKGQELQKMFKKNGEIEKFLSMSQKLSLTNLTLFNSDGKLTKYDYVEDIVVDFYEYRLKMYDLRKSYILKKLENQCFIYKYKVKFIKEYKNKIILLNDKKISEVLQQLEDRKYPKLANDHESLDKSYRYLTDMSIMSLTLDRAEELEEKLQECEDAHDLYLNTPVKQIWLNELDEFLVAYQTWLIEWENEINSSENVKDVKGKGKGKSKDKIKSKTNNDEDEKKVVKRIVKESTKKVAKK